MKAMVHRSSQERDAHRRRASAEGVARAAGAVSRAQGAVEQGESRPETAIQRLSRLAHQSEQARSTARYQSLLNGEPVQRKDAPTRAPNDTGLPDQLKAGVESLSGMSLDGV